MVFFSSRHNFTNRNTGFTDCRGVKSVKCTNIYQTTRNTVRLVNTNTLTTRNARWIIAEILWRRLISPPGYGRVHCRTRVYFSDLYVFDSCFTIEIIFYLGSVYRNNIVRTSVKTARRPKLFPGRVFRNCVKPTKMSFKTKIARRSSKSVYGFRDYCISTARRIYWQSFKPPVSDL